MLVVTRYRVEVDDQTAFRSDGRAALVALVARLGCLGAQLGRAVDDPTLWTLTTTWESVGAYRRALSSYEVKLVVVPLMYRAIDEPSAFEGLVVWTPAAGLAEHQSMLAEHQSMLAEQQTMLAEQQTRPAADAGEVSGG